MSTVTLTTDEFDVTQMKAFDDGFKAGAAALLAVAQEALEFVENQEDVTDGDYGQPQPNKAMQLAEVLRAAIAKATEAA